MSLGLCMCDSCESEENLMKKFSKKKLQEYNRNCKSCYIDELQQKKISSEMKTRETFYN